jgi:cytochrome P450
MMTSDASQAVIARNKLPVAGHILSLGQNPLRFLQRLRLEGDIVKIYIGTKPIYVVNSHDLIRQMLVEESDKFNKGKLFDKVRPFLGNGLANSDGAYHLRQRRLMQPAFHQERISEYANAMRSRAEEAVASWRPQQTIPVATEMYKMSFQTVARALFSAEPARDAIAEIQRSLPIVLKGVIVRTLSPFEPAENLPIPGNRRFVTAVDRLRRALSTTVAMYREDHSDHGDLLSMLLAARDSETDEAMTDEQVHDEIMTIFAAGTETVSASVSWLFHELGRHGSIERRLHNELDEVLGDRPIGFDDIAKLPYTRCVINESLRLHTPTWLLSRRVVSPVKIGGISLPVGAEVIYSPTTLHRDPRLFRDAMQFIPERWSSECADDVPRHAFIPFNSGSRKCIGDRFAVTEMTVVLATIAARWRLRPVTNRQVRERISTTINPGKLPMVVLPR